MANSEVRAVVAEAGRGKGEGVVDLLPGLIDHVHLVGCVLLPTHCLSKGRRIILVPAGLTLPEALLNVNSLDGAFRKGYFWSPVCTHHRLQ